MIELMGKTTKLRDWILADLEVYAEWMQPHHQWHQLDGPYYARPTSEGVQGIIHNLRRRIPESDFPTPRLRLVIADQASDRFLGTMSWYWISEETAWLAVGIVIHDPAEWGKGRGYEALGLWSEYLFHTLPQIVRLDLRTWSGNRGMIRLAEKVGYREEACFRKARIVDGQYYDGLGYGILREEWETRYPSGFAARLSED